MVGTQGVDEIRRLESVIQVNGQGICRGHLFSSHAEYEKKEQE
jgi:hypothetical protein